MAETVKPLGTGPANSLLSASRVSCVSVLSTDTQEGRTPFTASQLCSSGSSEAPSLICQTHWSWDVRVGIPCRSACLEKGVSPEQEHRLGWLFSFMHCEWNNGRVCHSTHASLLGDVLWARSPRHSLQTLPGADKTTSRLFVDQCPPSHTDICCGKRTSCLSPSPHTHSSSLVVELSYGSQDLKGDRCCPLHRMALLQVKYVCSTQTCFCKGVLGECY